MPSGDLSDDYLARVLIKDAQNLTEKYSSYGRLPKRSTLSAPKPNTRFLKTIIQETDHHNAALRAKECRESHARLRTLGQTERELNDEYSCHKRRRLSDPLQRSSEHVVIPMAESHDRQHERSGGKHERRGPIECDNHPAGHRQTQHEHRRRNHERGRRTDEERRSKHRRQRSRSRSRSYSPRRRHRSHRSSRRQRRRSPSSSSPHLSSPKKDSRHRRPQEAQQGNTLSSEVKRSRTDGGESDSDPLESLGLIGPKPPPKIVSRGRGTFASHSVMDNHFDATYDPTVDVLPDVVADEEDDWDQALEALKDRQRWQQQGAERLRQAGFTEDEVSKWEKGKGGVGLGGEGREEDVRWKGRGEGREWDQGKTVNEDGAIETKIEWGRLKGT